MLVNQQCALFSSLKGSMAHNYYGLLSVLSNCPEVYNFQNQCSGDESGDVAIRTMSVPTLGLEIWLVISSSYPRGEDCLRQVCQYVLVWVVDVLTRTHVPLRATLFFIRT